MRHHWWKTLVPWEPTTLMSAAGLRGATVFEGFGPLVPEYLKNTPFNWPRPGEHTELVKVVDWKVLVTQVHSPYFGQHQPCICLRCACYRNFLTYCDCGKRTESQDLPLLRLAYSHFEGSGKKRGVLFEARYWYQKKNNSLVLLAQE